MKIATNQPPVLNRNLGQISMTGAIACNHDEMVLLEQTHFQPVELIELTQTPPRYSRCWKKATNFLLRANQRLSCYNVLIAGALLCPSS